MPEPAELNEYEYMVGHVPIRAQLTDKQAKRLDAKPVGEAESPGTGNVVNNEADRQATATRESEDNGVKGEKTDEVISKARQARNKRSV